MTTPSPFPSPAAASAPLPPLPDLSNGPSQGPAPNPIAAIMSGIAPTKSAIDQIVSACQSIVKSGAVPGAEQICGQIVAMATSLLPMAAQNAVQSNGPISPMPSPQGPQPIAPQG